MSKAVQVIMSEQGAESKVENPPDQNYQNFRRG